MEVKIPGGHTAATLQTWNLNQGEARKNFYFLVLQLVTIQFEQMLDFVPEKKQ